MKKTLEKAASHGRFGDNRLIHVSDAEVDGLASLLPGGKLPINPKTGLPEAFFFLPFLAALAAAPAAAAAAPAAAALGTGLAAGAGAAATGLAGLTAAAPAAAGLGAAAAAPTAAAMGSGLLGSAATSGVASGLAATAPGLAAGGAGTALASTAPGALGLGAAAPTVGATGAGSLGATAAGSTGIGGLVAPASAAPAHAAMGIGANMAGNAMPVPGLQAAGQASQIGTTASMANPAGATAAGLTGPFPPGPMAAGAVPTGAANGGVGGLFGGMDSSKMLQYAALGAMMLPKGGGGKSSDDSGSKGDPKNYSRGDQADAPDQGQQGGVTKEFNYFPHAQYFAKGGLASLHGGRKPSAKKSASDEDLIDATVHAIQNQDPNAQMLMQEFVKQFGPQALQDLMQRTGLGGQQAGGQMPQQSSGDGLSDSVPAQINGSGGQAPAQLSEGEYVVPSDVVSHLGNGSSGAGAKQLEGMVARTRAARGATSAAPQQIDPQQMMPQ